MATKKTDNKAKDIALLGAFAAAAAGAYYFYGPKGAKRRAKAKKISKKAYEKIVDDAARAYGRAKKVDPAELKTLARDLKKHWAVLSRDISRDISRTAHSTKARLSRVAATSRRTGKKRTKK